MTAAEFTAHLRNGTATPRVYIAAAEVCGDALTDEIVGAGGLSGADTAELDALLASAALLAACA